MLAVHLFILSTLAGICIQDLRTRLVSWVLFPLLAVCLLLRRLLSGGQLSEVLISGASSLCFLGLLLLALTAYFSVKYRKVVNISDGLLCWADILTLCCFGLYMPLLNYFFFFFSAMVLTLCGWTLWRGIAAAQDVHIPLAGILCAFFACLYIAQFFWTDLVLTNDQALLTTLSSLLHG
jgi:hypothetical protein